MSVFFHFPEKGNLLFLCRLDKTHIIFFHISITYICIISMVKNKYVFQNIMELFILHFCVEVIQNNLKNLRPCSEFPKYWYSKQFCNSAELQGIHNLNNMHHIYSSEQKLTLNISDISGIEIILNKCHKRISVPQ